MLVDQINDSLKRLELGVTIENAQILKKDLDTLYSKISSEESVLKKYMRDSLETQKAIIEIPDEREQVVSALRRFCNDAMEGKKDYALQDLQNLVSEVASGNKELQRMWSDYKSQEYVSSANLISALSTVLEDDKKLDELSSLRTNIDSKSIGNAQTVKDIKAFRELTESLIEAKKLKPEIQEFVKKLAGGESILLCQITDEIYKWMKNNKLDKRVTLSITNG